ncbi:MAG TPA: serine hydrolase [Arenimonas sp.]|nr:serine hydrolase [Arenimonas sp.]
MRSIDRTLQAVLAAGMLLAAPSWAAPPADLDARVNTVMARYGVPGMAVAIVEDGKTVHARGYGVRRLGSTDQVDADTIFPTGSTGKAVTTAALAVLVDDGKIQWDDKVIDHMPGFQMYDPWVTREITIRDLLVHRSGLGLGAGDLLFVPRTSRSRADVVHAVRHIAPATSFRNGYAYDNLLYVVAGQLIEEVSGQSWEAFVRDRVFKPSGMSASTTEESARFATLNRAQPHARIDGPIRGFGTQVVLPEREGLGATAAPAGGVSSSANDMARWLTIQLGQGLLPGAGPDGRRLYSEAAAREMWTPQVNIPIRAYPGVLAPVTPQFSGYALGWEVRDYRGVKVIQHGGAVFGVQTMVVLIPEKDVAFSLQINSEDGEVLLGLEYELLDHYLGAPDHDWVGDFSAFKQGRAAGARQLLANGEQRNKASRPSLLVSGYTGAYSDPWYGPMAITQDKGRLRMDFRKTPNMAGTLAHWQYDTYVVTWDDRSIEPAYVSFALDAAGKVDRVTMKAVSPLADFSYDYQDLLFKPIPGK